jgi:transposase
MGIKPNRDRFSTEFKLDVVQQSYLRENIIEFANELGINPALIYKWRAMYQEKKDAAKPVFTGKGVPSLSIEQLEIAELKRQLADVRMERDILKKASDIFGKNEE